MAYVHFLETNPNNYIVQKRKSLQVSSSPTPLEKDIADYLSKAIHNEKEFKERNLLKVNFNVRVTRKQTIIDCIYLVNTNGKTTKVPFDYVLEDRRTNPLRKVGAFMFPLGTPTFIQVYADEMRESTNSPVSKIIFAGIVAALSQIFGWNLFYLVAGLLFIAVLDVLLSLVPGNIKEGTEKDHAIQAKFFAFVTNFLGLFAIAVGMEFLRSYAGDNMLSKTLSVVIPFTIAGWIYGIYIRRIVAYIARANKVKVPKRIKKVMDKLDREDIEV